jgi:hypothetical protein
MSGVAITKRFAKHLGSLSCACGAEWADAADRDSWQIIVSGGVLRTVLCPRCKR